MSLFTPNTDSITGFYEKGKFILAWRLVVLFGVAFSVLTVVFFNSTIEESVVYGLCTTIAIGSLFYLRFTKRYKPIYYFLSIVGTLIAFYTTNYFVSVVHIGDFLWMILIVLFTFFGLGIKHGLFFLFLQIGIIVYYVSFSINANIEHVLTLDTYQKTGLVIELTIASLSISYVTYQFLIFHNYSYNALLLANEELQSQNTIISSQNIEKTTLVQEVHHRVKNNLQIIISLLRLQQKEIDSEEAKVHFSEAINRIMVMSSIHKKLYNDKSLALISLKEYLTELTDEIINLSVISIPLKINISSEIDRIGLKTIVPLGLLINELVSNSIQHAFSKNENASINIDFKKLNEDNFIMIYNDNGNWVIPEKDHNSFGLELIEILTSQLDGDYSLTHEKNKTTYTFNMHNLDLEN